MSGADNCVVLLVEDDWLLRDMLADHLRNAGYEVHEAATAEGALALLQDGQQVDLLVTDITLGGYLSGWDVAEAFRDARPGIPVIYTSASAIEPRRQVPGSVFIHKPYDAHAVLDVCRKLR